MLIEIQWIPVDYSQNPVDFGDVLSKSVDVCRCFKMLWILVDLGKEHVFCFLVKLQRMFVESCQNELYFGGCLSNSMCFSGFWSKSSGCLWLLIKIHWMLMDFGKKHVGFLRILLKNQWMLDDFVKIQRVFVDVGQNPTDFETHLIWVDFDRTPADLGGYQGRHWAL